MTMLSLIQRFCIEQGIAPSRFGRLVANDPRFVFDLENGRQPRPATESGVIAFLATLADAPRQSPPPVPRRGRSRRTEGPVSEQETFQNRMMMQAGSARLLAAILRAMGEARS